MRKKRLSQSVYAAIYKLIELWATNPLSSKIKLVACAPPKSSATSRLERGVLLPPPGTITLRQATQPSFRDQLFDPSLMSAELNLRAWLKFSSCQHKANY